MYDWIATFPGYTKLLTQLKKIFGNVIQTGSTPNHVGLIMDGNRRYAKNQKIELKEGHNLGFESMANILELLYESGVKCATVYAFSIENFKRSNYEVKWLMDLAKSKFRQISQHGELCEQYGIRIKILGNISLLPKDVQAILFETEDITKNNTRATLNVCFPYTSRDDMTHAIQGTVNDYVKHQQQSQKHHGTNDNNEPDYIINEQTIDDHLYTNDSPPLDLLVRTSGTFRLSDFLLWQAVSPDCAVVFSDKLWPEFTPWDMAKILINWSFNQYWYGHGNGPVSTKILEPESFQHMTHANSNNFSVINAQKGASGFARFPHDADNEDDDEDNDEDEEEEDDDDNASSIVNSDIGGGDELDTATSAEEDVDATQDK